MFNPSQLQNAHPRALQKISLQLLLLRESIKDAQLTTPLIDHLNTARDEIEAEIATHEFILFPPPTKTKPTKK